MGRKKRTDPSGRDLKIIEIRDNGRHTLEELGKMFNLSKQRVLQICDRYNCRKFSNRVILRMHTNKSSAFIRNANILKLSWQISLKSRSRMFRG
jgi:hypothetical protein